MATGFQRPPEAHSTPTRIIYLALASDWLAVLSGKLLAAAPAAVLRGTSQFDIEAAATTPIGRNDLVGPAIAEGAVTCSVVRLVGLAARALKTGGVATDPDLAARASAPAVLRSIPCGASRQRRQVTGAAA